MTVKMFYRTLLLGLLFIATGAPAATPEITPQRQQELRHLLKQDCGSCHGLTLKGGLGPAITAEALAGKPREVMHVTILHGRGGTPMPPWSAILSEEEVTWLVELLYKGDLQ
jgi:cytochrome c55X